jgi:putative DNA primase/helicase
VLYIDGEMPLEETRERLQGFIFKQPEAPLEVLSHERFYQRFEKDFVVTDPDVQHALLTLLDAKKELRVVILDNLSSASRPREDKADDWRNCFLPFLIACRRRRVTVVLKHHTGKCGDQRGTGAREDHLDTSIRLSKPDDHTNAGVTSVWTSPRPGAAMVTWWSHSPPG